MALMGLPLQEPKGSLKGDIDWTPSKGDIDTDVDLDSHLGCLRLFLIHRILRRILSVSRSPLHSNQDHIGIASTNEIGLALVKGGLGWYKAGLGLV